MKLTDIKCNGESSLSPSAELAAPYLQTAISVFRLRYTEKDILTAIHKLNPNGDYYFGIRCSNDSSIYYRIAIAISLTAYNELFKGISELSKEQFETLQKYIVNFVESLNGSEMDALIIDAFRDCAEADHWYKFEKQWD